MKKYFGFALLLSFAFLLTACGSSDDEKDTVKPETKQGLSCTIKGSNTEVAQSTTQVILDYNDDATLITKYTKVETTVFTEQYAQFAEFTENEWKAACDQNLQHFESCDVTRDGASVVMKGVIKVSADRAEELNEGVFAKTSREEAKKNYETAGYTCE